MYIEVIDPAGKRIGGWTKAAGTGETFDSELIDAWTNSVVTPYETFVSAGTAITSASNSIGAEGICYKDLSLTSQVLYKIVPTDYVLVAGHDTWFIVAEDSTLSLGTYDYRKQSPITAYFTRNIGACLGFRATVSSEVQSFTLGGLSLKKVLAPSATGVTIVNSKAGDQYNWDRKDEGFDYNASAGYTYILYNPSMSPSVSPSGSPSISPSISPSASPSLSPSASISPSFSPSVSPSLSPSSSPSVSPSLSPSVSSSLSPSESPSLSPSASESPSVSPSESPSISPSFSPSFSPSVSPSESPSVSPSESPSVSPSESPSISPSASVSPSKSPSASPSLSPSSSPSYSPSLSPSVSPSKSPSESPSASPSLSPSASLSPSKSPSASPSVSPSEA